MSILYMGNREQLTKLLLGQDKNTHYVDTSSSLTDIFLLNKRFEMVIIDGDVFERDKGKIISSIHMMGSMLKQTRSEDRRGHCGSGSCGITWSERGELIMNCRMHQPRKNNHSAPALTGDEIIFEFHSSCDNR